MDPSTNRTPSTESSNSDVARAKEAIAHGAQHLTEEVKTAATAAAGKVKKGAASKMDAGRDFAAEHLGSVADALRSTGESLKTTDSPLTDYVGKAATAVDGVSNYLQTRTLSQLMGDMEGYARREPAMFLGASFVAGLLGGRFLKSATPAHTLDNDTRGGRSFGALPQYAGQGARSGTPAARGKDFSRYAASHQPAPRATASGTGSGVVASATSELASSPSPTKPSVPVTSATKAESAATSHAASGRQAPRSEKPDAHGSDGKPGSEAGGSPSGPRSGAR